MVDKLGLMERCKAFDDLTEVERVQARFVLGLSFC